MAGEEGARQHAAVRADSWGGWGARGARQRTSQAAQPEGESISHSSGPTQHEPLVSAEVASAEGATAKSTRASSAGGGCMAWSGGAGLRARWGAGQRGLEGLVSKDEGSCCVKKKGEGGGEARRG